MQLVDGIIKKAADAGRAHLRGLQVQYLVLSHLLLSAFSVLGGTALFQPRLKFLQHCNREGAIRNNFLMAADSPGDGPVTPIDQSEQG